MCEEVFEMVCSMDRRKVELQLVLQCAPTIAGLKTSNLLIVPRDLEDKVRFVLRRSGLLGYRLVYDKKRVIFLVFNRDKLVNYLSSKEVREFLVGYGYRTDAFGYCLRFFQERYDSFVHNRKDFPHEMGVFLGYPLHDVKGFIENGGDNFELSGYWKVYSDERHAQELFERFDIVKDDMVRMISRGDSINSIVSYYQADEANVVFVSDASIDELKSAKAFALGCPAMGAEVLEEGEMEPFVTDLEGFVSGKTIGLFGSYGWGDGQWMRDWVDRMTAAGATVLNGEGVICQEAPDGAAEAECKALGKALAAI